MWTAGSATSRIRALRATENWSFEICTFVRIAKVIVHIIVIYSIVDFTLSSAIASQIQELCFPQ